MWFFIWFIDDFDNIRVRKQGRKDIEWVIRSFCYIKEGESFERRFGGVGYVEVRFKCVEMDVKQ